VASHFRQPLYDVQLIGLIYTVFLQAQVDFIWGLRQKKGRASKVRGSASPVKSEYAFGANRKVLGRP
jgi:hypothetical protein